MADSSETQPTRLLGEILVEDGYLQPTDLRRLVQHQRSLPLGERRPLGRLAVELGYLSENQLRDVLDTHGKRLSLGELLVARGAVTREDLSRALQVQAEDGGLLGEILVRSGCLDEVTLAETLAEQSDLAYVPLGADDPLEPALARWVNPYYASHHGIVPVGRLGRRLTVALWHPSSLGCAAEIENSTGMHVRFVISTRSQVDASIQKLYGLAPEPPRSGGKPRSKSGSPSALTVEGPLAPFSFDTKRASELDAALRGDAGVFLVTGAGGAQLEELYLRLWRYAQELDRDRESTCEGVGDVRTPESAERLFRARTSRGVRLGFLAAEHATAALQRLLDLGVHPDRLQGMLLGILAVCSVRQTCAQCAEPYEPHTLVLHEWFGGAPVDSRIEWRRGRGCKACDGIGFLGEIVLSELWLPDETERQQIAHKVPMRTIREHAHERIETLGRNGLGRAKSGQTTLEELLKRLPVEEVRSVRQAERARPTSGVRPEPKITPPRERWDQDRKAA